MLAPRRYRHPRVARDEEKRCACVRAFLLRTKRSHADALRRDDNRGARTPTSCWRLPGEAKTEEGSRSTVARLSRSGRDVVVSRAKARARAVQSGIITPAKKGWMFPLSRESGLTFFRCPNFMFITSNESFWRPANGAFVGATPKIEGKCPNLVVYRSPKASTIAFRILEARATRY